MFVNMLGIGVDIVHIPRIVNIISRHRADRFASRILSKQELVDWQALGTTTPLPNRARFLAVRWGVKEAIYKAMFPVVQPTRKEVTYRGLLVNGTKPSVEYHPSSLEDEDKIGRIHVSVTHDGDYVYTTVLVEDNVLKNLQHCPSLLLSMLGALSGVITALKVIITEAKTCQKDGWAGLQKRTFY